MRESEQRKQARIRRGREFREALLKRQRRVKPGWQKDLARASGFTEQQISKIVSGARAATIEQMVKIAEALEAPELMPSDLPLPATSRTSGQSRVPSDRPATVAASIPSDLAEYLIRRGREDGVDPHGEELEELAQAAFLEDKPRSPEFYSSILGAIRRAKQGAGARGKGS